MKSPIDQKSDRDKSTFWAAQLLEDDNWAILDTETTGLGDDAQICQVGLLTSTNTEGFQTYVKPTVPIEPGATDIHGICYDAVASAPYFDQVFLNILKIVGRRDLVIYNQDYDLRLIRQSAKVHGIHLAFPTSDRRNCRLFTNGGSIHCAMQWYSQWVGEWRNDYGNYKWQKLPGGDHSALGDCKAVETLIKKMAGVKS